MNLCTYKGGEAFKSFLLTSVSRWKKGSSNQNITRIRVDLCLGGPRHEEYRWSNWAGGELRVPSHWGKPLHPYQRQLVGRFRQQAIPFQDIPFLHINEIPQMPARAKCRSCEHTANFAPLPPAPWAVDAVHGCQSHNYTEHETLIFGKRPKNLSCFCRHGFIFAFA